MCSIVSRESDQVRGTKPLSSTFSPTRFNTFEHGWHLDVKVPVMRGSEVMIKQVNDDLTIVTNHGVTSKIVQADIECSNGYIHLIDKVVVKVKLQT